MIARVFLADRLDNLGARPKRAWKNDSRFDDIPSGCLTTQTSLNSKYRHPTWLHITDGVVPNFSPALALKYCPA